MEKKKIAITAIILLILGYKVLFPGFLNMTDNKYRIEETEPIQQETLESKEEVDKRVYITGAVKNSGVVVVKEEERLDDAVKKLGGLTEEADLERINLAIILEDGMHYKIPKIGEEVVEEEQQKDGKVNINRADKSELENIPGVGPATADKIIKYRENEGKFATIEDVKNVNGIGEKKFENMKDSIKCQ